jgi:hypothetical protein
MSEVKPPRLNHKQNSERAYWRRDYDAKKREEERPLAYIQKVFDRLSPDLQWRFFERLCYRFKRMPPS